MSKLYILRKTSIIQYSLKSKNIKINNYRTVILHKTIHKR